MPFVRTFAGCFTPKIPRARLYIPTALLLGALARLPFSRLQRGEETEQLEAGLARACGVRHARLVSTCRIAFYLVLKSLGLQPGDEVLLTPLTIPDMVNAIHTLGLKPVFVDLSPHAQNIDLRDLEAKVSPRSRVLLVTHLSGLVPQMQAILEEAGRHRLTLIEDISQNWGARAQGQPLGTFGSAAVGSLSIGKTLASVGGGVLLTSDDRLHAAVNRHCGQLLKRPSRGFLLGQILANLKFNIATQPFVFSWLTYPLIRILCARNPAMINLLQEGRRTAPGSPEDLPFECNPRILRNEMPPEALTHFCNLQSRVLRLTLRTHRQMDDRRRERVRQLTSLLSDETRRHLPAACLDEGENRNVYWHYPLVVPSERQRFQMFLLRSGIDNGGYALALCSREPVFDRYAAPTPCAHRIKEKTVFLPIHSSFSRRQMEWIAQVVNQYFALYPTPPTAPGGAAADDAKVALPTQR